MFTPSSRVFCIVSERLGAVGLAPFFCVSCLVSPSFSPLSRTFASYKYKNKNIYNTLSCLPNLTKDLLTCHKMVVKCSHQTITCKLIKTLLLSSGWGFCCSAGEVFVVQRVSFLLFSGWGFCCSAGEFFVVRVLAMLSDVVVRV